MTIRIVVIVITFILLFVGLVVNDKSQQKIFMALTAVGIVASLFSPDDKIVVWLQETSAITQSPVPSSTASFTPSPTTPFPTITPTPVSEPQSLYARALKRSVVEHIHYEDWEKANIITETYYDRKYDDGTHKEWYTSAKYDDRNTGYTIGLYFADGLLFFASAYHVGEADAVTFYFWGDQMLACHNLIGGEDSLSYAGSDTYNYMVSAFGNIYEKAQLYAQDAE